MSLQKIAPHAAMFAGFLFAAVYSSQPTTVVGTYRRQDMGGVIVFILTIIVTWVVFKAAYKRTKGLRSAVRGGVQGALKAANMEGAANVVKKIGDAEEMFFDKATGTKK